jgi:16S rRNA processing protein RimM
MQPMDPAQQWIVLAHILRPQGRHGEVLADLFTDFPERFAERPKVWLAAPGMPERATFNEADTTLAEVKSHWLPVGRNAGRIVLHFTGVDTIEQAEQIAGKEVVVPISERTPLESGAAYISDLVGCTVYDRDRVLGVVEELHFPTTPDGSRRLEEAAPLLAIKSSQGDEILVPFASAFLLDLNVTGKSIRMALPEGLAEINQPGNSAAAGE